MDGFAEANLLLNSALEQLDSLIINGVSSSLLVSLNAGPVDSPWSPKIVVLKHPNVISLQGFSCSSTTLVSISLRRRDERLMSDASSEVESPLSDVPTTSSSPCYSPKPKVYCDFLKAIEDNLITERPSRETQLKIMQWLTGNCVSVVSYRFYVRSLNHSLFCVSSINKLVVFLCRHCFPSDSIF
ncbi:unnamed protein product [Angiostrongylus costaricensis]|uniref:Uncharacterized protein n=1 Tax=Angiostrongylus costaricensis TaxID=334426 RepID=A0A0R3PQL6_ANGCS|nr:unnamed protein product [Angiostrongylus costaricensis]